jgi:hypothetical protein
MPTWSDASSSWLPDSCELVYFNFRMLSKQPEPRPANPAELGVISTVLFEDVEVVSSDHSKQPQENAEDNS